MALGRTRPQRTKVPGVVKTPRGMDELYVHDPHGSLVKFGQVTERFTPAETVREAPSG